MGRASSLITEQTLTILPLPRSIIAGATARATRKALVRLTSSSCRHLLELEVDEGPADCHPRVVDEDVDRAERLEAAADGGLVGDVERGGDGALDVRDDALTASAVRR